MKPISRRDFIRLSGWTGLSAFLAACGMAASLPTLTREPAPVSTGTGVPVTKTVPAPSEDSRPREAQVLVLGAGMAGLSAARALTGLGHSVILLEGRNRIGGRLWTDASLGLPLDLGASWIHGTRGNPIADLAKRFGARTVPTDYDHIVRYAADGRELSDAQSDAIDANLEALFERMDDLREEVLDIDISLARALERLAPSPIARETLYAFNTTIEHEYGGALADLSLFEFDQEGEFDGDDVIFPGGYAQIVDGLMQGLDIRLNALVQRVAHGDGGVMVETSAGVFRGQRAVVTLPLGVLKQARVRFDPLLPDFKLQAIARLNMGILNKCYLKFDEVFWDEQAHLLGYIGERTGEWAEWLNLYPLLGQPVLLGFNAAGYGLAIESLEDADIVAGAMQTLRAIYGDIPEPTGHLITRWGADPFTFGSYSHIPPGASGADYDSLAAPVGGRLFFAGEATHREHPSTVHGAYLSGLRAAQEIDAL